jgi:anti-sigma regulatory factor (Ser/Thr protein kinase)
MQLINSFELQICNDLTELRRMSEWLQNAAESIALPSPIAWNLDLCANEAVANIILYAYQDHDPHQIYLRLELKKNHELYLLIQDDGKPFDPFKAFTPTLSDNIEDAKIGGLGIHLIRSLMDECNYCRSDGKNIITLTVRLNHTSACSFNNKDNTPSILCNS